MTRAELRRAKRDLEKGSAVFNLTRDQIEQIKQDATNEGVKTAFILLLSIPVMIIHDKYPLLVRKEVNGKTREERLAEMILDLYDSYERGYLELSDLEQCLKEETGMEFKNYQGGENGRKKKLEQ